MRSIIAITLCLCLNALPVGAADPDPAPMLVEVQPDPIGPDRGNEWFELANPGPVDLVLDGWAVTDGDACSHPDGSGRTDDYAYPLDGRVVPAGGVLQVVIEGAGSCLLLRNTDDELTLLAPGGVPIQTVAWGPDASLPAPGSGESVHACTFAATHLGWAVGPATPGTSNPAC